jgi:hypothetical protein
MDRLALRISDNRGGDVGNIGNKREDDNGSQEPALSLGRPSDTQEEDGERDMTKISAHDDRALGQVSPF